MYLCLVIFLKTLKAQREFIELHRETSSYIEVEKKKMLE